MLSVDQNIVQDNIPSFVSALCLIFGSYYCFNKHYLSCLASTLEFLQRCVFLVLMRLTFSLYLEIAATVTWGLGDLSDHECRDAQ